MRMFARAAAVAIGLGLTGTALAEPWNDPAGRMKFEPPRGWLVRPQRAPADQTIVMTFNPTNDCYLYSIDNPNTATRSPAAVHNSNAPLAAANWLTAANALTPFFPNNSAELVSQSVDTAGFWPVQRAELRSGTRTVWALLMARPGFEFRAFCSGATAASTYDPIFNSLGHANDATWQAEGERILAERAAQANAPAPPPPEPTPEPRRRRGN